MYVSAFLCYIYNIYLAGLMFQQSAYLCGTSIFTLLLEIYIREFTDLV